MTDIVGRISKRRFDTERDKDHPVGSGFHREVDDMSIANVTPVELAAYVAGEEQKKREFAKKEKNAKKKVKASPFETMVAYYSASENVYADKYVTYGKNKRLV